MIKRYRFAFITSSLLLLVILSACGGSQSGTSGTQPQPAGNGMIDRIDGGGFGGGSNPQVNFHPYSPNNLISDIYEPLMAQNTYSCIPEPWLATNYRWQDSQTLIFTIREGIKWSDGQPFGPDDVVFTLNMLQKNPALDTEGLWKSLSSVVKAEGNQVIYTFKVPSVTLFERVIRQDIVAKHIWEKVDDPVTFTNDKPVTTGPFLFESFNQQQLVLVRNPGYWQADKIKVERIYYHKAAGPEIEQLKLARGEYDMNAMFVPNIEQSYVAKNPKNNHYWFPAGGEISLGMNLTKAPFNDLEFRRAMAYSINRDEISKKAVFGYVKPASQSGLSVPGQSDFLPPGIPDMGIFPFDQQQAIDILDKAGYKKDANGKILGKDGKPLEVTFLVQNGWSDWIQASQIIQANLNTMGITLNVETPAPEVIETRREAADYDMLFSVHGGSCTMYENYYYLDSRADKKNANTIHHNNPDVDKMLDQLKGALTIDAQKEIVAQLAQYSYEQFPDVPLWYGPNWFQYSTKKAVGWPNANDPYCKPGDFLIILTHLKQSPDYKPGK